MGTEFGAVLPRTFATETSLQSAFPFDACYSPASQDRFPVAPAASTWAQVRGRGAARRVRAPAWGRPTPAPLDPRHPPAVPRGLRSLEPQVAVRSHQGGRAPQRGWRGAGKPRCGVGGADWKPRGGGGKGAGRKGQSRESARPGRKGRRSMLPGAFPASPSHLLGPKNSQGRPGTTKPPTQVRTVAARRDRAALVTWTRRGQAWH
jgi:hypothetical protein